jgi:hypothetical protein
MRRAAQVREDRLDGEGDRGELRGWRVVGLVLDVLEGQLLQRTLPGLQTRAQTER